MNLQTRTLKINTCNVRPVHTCYLGSGCCDYALKYDSLSKISINNVNLSYLQLYDHKLKYKCPFYTIVKEQQII